MYQDLPPTAADYRDPKLGGSGNESELHNHVGGGSKFGIILPNPAPEVAPTTENQSTAKQTNSGYAISSNKGKLFLTYLSKYIFD